MAADAFHAEIANVLKSDAQGILIQFDPVKDKDNDGTISSAEQSAYDNQVVVSLDEASVTITKLNLTGSLRPYTRSNGTTIPGLVVRNNGFQLGEAAITYGGTLNFAGLLDIEGITVGISDFGVTFGQSVDFSGEIYIAANRAELFPGKAFNLKLTDGTRCGS